MKTADIPDELIERLRQRQPSPRITVLTGAGVSAESGIPTFREAQTGLWEKFRAEDLASPQAFLRNPQMVWEWYAWRRQKCLEVTPNPAHLSLVEMEKHFPVFTLITQNVDSLHQRAGSQNIIELHGNILRSRCFKEGTTYTERDDINQIPPLCPRCGAFLRPDVVWFGEMLPMDALNQARQAAQNCDIFFSIGTSSQVQPAASLSLFAYRNGAIIVEINPEDTPLTSTATFGLREPAGLILPIILQEVIENGMGH